MLVTLRWVREVWSCDGLIKEKMMWLHNGQWSMGLRVNYTKSQYHGSFLVVMTLNYRHLLKSCVIAIILTTSWYDTMGSHLRLVALEPLRNNWVHSCFFVLLRSIFHSTLNALLKIFNLKSFVKSCRQKENGIAICVWMISDRVAF